MSGATRATAAAMRRLVSWTIGGLVLISGLVVGGANALLASDLPQRWANDDPAHLRLHYDRAWMLWPPMVLHLEGFDVSFQDPDTQVQITADHVSGRISVFALKALRLEARDLEASGVVFKLRPRVSPDDATVHRDWLPSIDGFPDGDKHTGEVWPALITFDLAGMKLSQVREVWVGEVRYRGTASLSGDMVFEPLRSLALKHLEVADTGSTVTRGPTSLMAFDALLVKAELDRMPFGNLTPADFKKLSATVSVRGVLDSASIANFAVRSVPWLDVTGADGSVTADVNIVRGVLASGSTFTSKAPGVTLRTRSLSLTGEGELKVTVLNDGRRLELSLQKPTVFSPEGKPWMKAERFRVVSTGPADLSAPDVFDGTLTLTQARADDLRFINRFIPNGTGLSVISGRAHLNATFAIDTVTSRGSGELHATAEEFELGNRASRLVGEAALVAHVRSIDLGTGAMRLDGSSFAITNARIFADQKDYAGFWLKLSASELVLKPGPMTSWDTTVALELAHLQPVLGLVAARVAIPFPLRLMAEHRNVSATASLHGASNTVAVSELRVHADALDVWGDMQLRGGPGAWGAFLVKSPPVVAGLKLRGPMATPVLVDAEPWFRKQRVAQAGR